MKKPTIPTAALMPSVRVSSVSSALLSTALIFTGVVLAGLDCKPANAEETETTAVDEVSFNRDVRSILSDRCFKCHGPDAENQDSEFRLDTREHATADLGGYFGIVPGNLEESEFHARIRSEDDGDRMPPPESIHQLSEAEKDVLDRWIAQGAQYEGHWAFEKLPAKVDVPSTASTWPLNPIDQFVAAMHSAKGVTPNRPASREKWLRRVTFDLTGLPPTLEEIDSFLNDDSEQAFERVVDRLLNSDACAERLASEWLDVARYSDSYGYQRDDARYVWPWRDWVINAFRKNMPFDQFVQWQLAGDLMPDASREQILATAFNRLHSHKKEGGVALEEFRVENVADRTHTVAAALMGLTLECARCHDHKYDPITTKDYYRLTSYFANIDERGLISYFTDAVPTPALSLPSEGQEAQLAAAEKRIAEAESVLSNALSDAEKDFDGWLDQWAEAEVDDKTDNFDVPGLVASLSFEELLPPTEEESKNESGKKVGVDSMRAMANAVEGRPRAVTPVANQLVEAVDGNGIRLTGDDAVVLPGTGHFGRHQPFSVSIWIRPTEITERAVIFRRSRGWDDAGTIGYELTKEGDRLSAKLCHFWPGDAICVETTEPLTADRWRHVTVTYDGSSKAAGLQIYVDGTKANTTIVQDCLTRTITAWRSGYPDLAIGSRYRDRGFKNGEVDEFRVFDRQLSPLEVQHVFGQAFPSQLRSRQKDSLAAEEVELLKDYFVSAIHPTSHEARVALAEARKERNAVVDSMPAITVMRERERQRPVYVLTRGVYDQRGEQVTSGTPGFLPSMSEDLPANRLGLAEWLTSSDHPLTSRVAINRYWQLLFGEGLVRTPEDFGNQGEPPTHPELLDWLARDFVDGGWDIRRMLRMVVLSATYRQSAVVSTESRNKDPDNLWLSRGPSQRLSAEMIRDNVLAASGLLVKQLGGPPVKPYDVALAYTPMKVDEGENLYRRSLYTFWKRTAPSPVLMTMNASKREVCRMQREVTSSPLQALVLLNGPQFTEASCELARKSLKENEGDVAAVIDQSFRILTSRSPSAKERSILNELFEQQLAEYEANPELAAELPGVGKAAADSGLTPARLAAVTVLVNAIMNLDECVRHQ